MLELQDIVFEVPLAEGSRETKRIIDGISLTIDTDKFVVITGPNGGGKSTLAKLIMGIEKPTSGKIIFKGQDITNASIKMCIRDRRWSSRLRLPRQPVAFLDPSSKCPLLDRDRFCEVARLVDIATAIDRYRTRKQLQRHACRNGHEGVAHARDIDNLVGELRDVGVALRGDGDDGRTARFRFF